MPIRRVSSVLGAALTVSALVLTGCSGGSNAVDQTNGGQYRYVGATKVGSLIPVAKRKAAGNAKADLLDGDGKFSLSAERGKVVVLNFWATNCAPCVIETPELDKLYRRVKGEGVNFVGIAVKDLNKDAVRAFIRDKNISYAIVYDEIGRTALQLGKFPVVGLPDTVVVDRQGRVAAVYVGAVAQGDLAPVLASLVKET